MIKKILIPIIISILFISCLEVDSKININEGSTGLWSLQYRISQEAVFITPGLEFNGFNYFPVNEEDLIKRINEITCLEIISISSKETTDFIEISVEMSFGDIENIESFFNNYSESPIVQINREDEGVLRFIIENPFDSDIDQETLELLSALYSRNMIKIVTAIPGIVTDSSTGVLSEDPGEAAWEIGITEIITLSDPAEWIINYE